MFRENLLLEIVNSYTKNNTHTCKTIGLTNMCIHFSFHTEFRRTHMTWTFFLIVNNTEEICLFFNFNYLLRLKYFLHNNYHILHIYTLDIQDNKNNIVHEKFGNHRNFYELSVT